MTRLILLRHGESTTNLSGIGTGQTDVPLTEKGHIQARLAARYLLEHEHIDAVCSSDLQRTYNTALPTAEALGLEIKTYAALREMDIGKWVGLTAEERREKFPQESAEFAKDFSTLRYPDGEYVPEVYDRVVECVRSIAEENDGKTVLIATHAGAIRVFEAFAKGYSRLESGVIKGCDNAAINIFGWENGKAFSIELNITSHLAAQSSAVATEEERI